MSRSSLSNLALILAVAAAACSDAGRSTAPTILPPNSPERLVNPQLVNPASSDWHQEARKLVGQANMSPLAASRVYAALGVAQYRVLRAIPGGGQEHRGAVAGVSATVLTFLFPSAAAELQALVTAASDAAKGSTHPQFERGLATGRKAAASMVERLKNDRFTVPWTGTVPTGSGMWIANGPPAGATFSGVKTYFLTSSNQFRPAPPPTFGSAAFLTDLAEIKLLSDTRTADQRTIANQWNYPTGTMTPPGYWNQITSQYIAEHGLDELGAARVYALAGGAMQDALIACWEAKYNYWFIRPSQAQPAITLVFALPNHPSYPSGHSCVSSAAATMLTAFFPEHASELAASVTQAGLSRMYAGIHYRFDITAGAKLGADVANWALAHAQRVE